ncbi:hypothetical protein [Collinsella ihumii]|uniref:Uncharacterized protein n=1 Tax=Collinsella ihumii TaxID=1720204 RepID=A0ABT7XHI7_9ACTN|nr:hypothetical protein [Collinsella ihumii]MDN0064885.1 hypothetical protein [Collinsella ihumii]
MQLNELEIVGRCADEDRICFELDCDWDDAAALNGQKLTVADGGKTVEEFYGYKLHSIDESSDGTLYCWFALKLDDATKESIAQISESVNSIQKDLQSASLAFGLVDTVARLVTASIDFETVSAYDVVSIADYIQEWVPGIQLGRNAPVTYNGKLYRTSQAIAETQEQYPPDIAGESLYYPIEVADDGIIVYRTCHGDYDAVRKGEKRHYPDARGPVYVSLIDYNSTIPGSDERWWELVKDE